MRLRVALLAAFILSSCSNATHDSLSALDPADSPETRIGERLFRETRFSQLYFSESAGNVNAAVAAEPSLSTMPRLGQRLRNPFSGQTMSCVGCHMVDDAADVAGAGMRAYADFAFRTLVPVRADGLLVTTRNTPTLVGAAETRQVTELFHYDGEFATLEDLVVGGWTGRNFGWFAADGATALAHVAEVLRGDNGRNVGGLATGSLGYATLLKGEDPTIPAGFLLSASNRIDPATATDTQLVNAAARLVVLYMRSLQFSKNLATGEFNGSPYDEFLNVNGLPAKPDSGESDSDYADRLARAVAALASPKWVDGEFESHDHAYRFGPIELRGLRSFLARSKTGTATSPGFPAVGNCVSCHTPPNFTDFQFHNSGATQDEYDSIHGAGAFVNLTIPDDATRMGAYDTYLPATASHPNALGPFRTPPSADHAGQVDLGLWNVAFNTDFPTPQSAILSIICPGNPGCTAAATLDSTIGLFKTPGLRDLGHSDPYLHTGTKRTVEEVIEFYFQQSVLVRQSQVRNADPKIGAIQIGTSDFAALAAFLRALDEDYE